MIWKRIVFLFVGDIYIIVSGEYIFRWNIGWLLFRVEPHISPYEYSRGECPYIVLPFGQQPMCGVCVCVLVVRFVATHSTHSTARLPLYALFIFPLWYSLGVLFGVFHIGNAATDTHFSGGSTWRKKINDVIKNMFWPNDKYILDMRMGAGFNLFRFTFLIIYF